MLDMINKSWLECKLFLLFLLGWCVGHFHDQPSRTIVQRFDLLAIASLFENLDMFLISVQVYVHPFQEVHRCAG